MEKTHAPDDFNSLNVLYVMYIWRKPLIIIGISAIIISAIVALCIQDKYKSTVILFPAVTNSTSRALLSDTYSPLPHSDVLEFGAEEEAEQMLQILNSDEIRTRISEKYNLMEHYHIDPNDKFKHTILNDDFQGNVTFKRTELMSVKIEVMDSDPAIGAAIANDIANFHDSVKIHIQRQRALQALKIVEKEYFAKEGLVKLLSDSLMQINKLGVSDIESQVERTTEQYTIAVRMGDQRAIKAVEEKLKVLSDYGTDFLKFRDNLYAERKQLIVLRAKYQEAKVDAYGGLPQKFVVSSAFPAEKKSYPIRWVIILVSTIATLLISILAIVLVENMQKYKAR